MVDGGIRDSKFILELGFPVFSRYRCPRDIVGVWVPDQFEESIEIGEAIVHYDDYIFGDIDGVVVIPKACAQEVVERVEVVMSTENMVRKAILSGANPREAYLEYGLF